MSDGSLPPSAGQNRFLAAPVGRTFVANALPMVLIMTMHGLQNVVDAAFLGHFVGADAMAAVSIIFPVLMFTIALSSLVSGGMSSLLARYLGAGDHDRARQLFARAHGLAFLIAAILIGLFIIGGSALATTLAAGNTGIAGMAHLYLLIMICATPVQFLLGLHADTWRNEGGAGMMAAMSLGVTVGNIILNYLLIVQAGMGIAGSAWGTVLAQGLALAIMMGWRARGRSPVPLSALLTHRWVGGWGAIVRLGAPVCLSFLGVSMVATVVVLNLKATAGTAYADTVAAYGIVTRIYSFAYLPILAVALATQSIVGNNVGAGLYHRSDATLRLSLRAMLVFCLIVEGVLLFTRDRVGLVFVQDPAVVTAVADILGPTVSFYLFLGPIMILAFYFQAVGQPGRSALLTLVKPFLLLPALVTLLALTGGTDSMWYGYPAADLIVAATALTLAASLKRRSGGAAGFGLAAPIPAINAPTANGPADAV